MASTADVSSTDANADARGKRPVWNVPPNGSAAEVTHVMDALSWPALSEATKASPKSSSSESLKSLSDGSSPPPLLQVTLASIPSSKQNIINPSPNPAPNAHAPVRQKSMKRGGGGGSPLNGVVAPANSADMPQASEPSPRGQPGKHNEQHGPKSVGGMSPQSHAGGENQHRGYGGGRRVNNGGGGGAHHQSNYGNRRNQEWSHQHNFYMQQQKRGGGGVGSYARAPTPFVGGPPSPVRPYVANPMGFPEMPSPIVYVTPHPASEALRGVSPFGAPPPIFFPALDPQRAQLLKQIDYYFSAANLCKDLYLRKKMDEQGWVPITVIAGFNRVMQLTNNIQYILETVRLSTIVEVQGEKIRKRNDWIQWLLPPASGSGSGSPSPTTENYGAVAARLQAVGIDGTAAHHNSMGGPIPTDLVLTRSASVILNSQFQVSGDPTVELSGQFTGFIDADRSKSIRSLARSDTL